MSVPYSQMAQKKRTLLQRMMNQREKKFVIGEFLELFFVLILNLAQNKI